MEQTKKKSNYGFLFAILKVILGIVILVALVLGGIYLYVRIALGIDIFGAIRSVKKLGQDFQIETIVDSPFTDADSEGVEAQFDNAGLVGFYTKDADGNYTVKADISSLPNATCDIKLTDKQLAAFMQTAVISSLQLEGEDVSDLSFEIKQVKFSNYKSSTTGPSIDVNIVLCTSITSLKKTLDVFPLSIVTKYLPDDLYISASFTAKKTGNKTFAVEGLGLKLNGLSESETATILDILGRASNLGDSYSISAEVGNTVMQALVCGKNGEAGFTTELAPLNIDDYNFEKDSESNTIYFVFKVRVSGE